MDFFLETGVYVLIVALAAAVAGFVAFRLFMSLRGVFKLGKLRRSAARSSKKMVDPGTDGSDQPAPKAGVSVNTAATSIAPSGTQTAGVMAAGPDGAEANSVAQPEALMPTHTPEGVARDGELGAHDSRAKNHGDAPTREEAVTSQSVEDSAADDEQHPDEESSEQEPSSEEDEPLKTVVALPEERDGEDAFMAMFGNDDNEESSVGDLASAVEETDLSALLDDAKSLVVVLRREGGSDA